MKQLIPSIRTSCFLGLPLFLLFFLMMPLTDCLAEPASNDRVEVAPAYHAPGISFDADGFTIQGHRRILLIGTLAYFRLDPSDWDRWLGLFAGSGFNTIDCIVPWNFHEPIGGRFDFQSPTHDLPRFLRLCRKHHLYVFIRTGPYICDEWDGGGLPAWLIPKGRMRFRQNDPVYMSYVRPWMKAVDHVVAPFQITHGGPVILYQVENELDYIHCDDPAGYVGALGRWAREDGIDVPVTACIGWRGLPIHQATGDADDILPTANLYVGDNIEAAGRAAIDALHAEHTVSGESMASLPAICSETGRDENTLRRLLASGLKGIAPFNFAAGSNFLFGSGDNNWRRPISYISTSVDFGGMISFDGRRTPNWYAARRLAGFVNTFSDLLCRARSDTDWEGGFSVSNPALGANESASRRRSYRLTVPGSSTQFVFLWNGSDQPQTTTITAGGMTVPRYSTLAVSPDYDQIVPMNIDLAPWALAGWTLRYATSEIENIETAGDTTRITLVGEQGAQGEVSLACPSSTGIATAVLGVDGARPSIHTAAGDWTAVYTVGATQSIRLSCGSKRLVLLIKPREKHEWPPAADPIDLTANGAWTTSPADWPSAQGADDSNWQVSPAADPSTLESYGILHGAGWYRARFTLTGSAASAQTLQFAHAGDVVSAYLNGVYLGTKTGTGAELAFETKGALKAGDNVLVVRVEIWGHSNFEDAHVPSLNLGSPRGIWGPVLLDHKPISFSAGWRISTEDRPAQARAQESAGSGAPAGTAIGIAPGAVGEARWLESTVDLDGTHHCGITLQIEGTNLLGYVFFNGQGVGRFFFGPESDPKMTAGPPNRFYIPPAWIGANGHDRLQIFVISTGVGATLSQIGYTSAGD